MNKIKIVIAGNKGKMGLAIESLARDEQSRNHEKFEVMGFEKNDSPEKIIAAGDVLIDFTEPSATSRNLLIARQYLKPMVIGTTGLSIETEKSILESSNHIAIVKSSNMSLGMNLLWKLSELAVKAFQPLNVDIIETHHNQKKDAPSGSALSIKKSILDVNPQWNGRIGEHSIRSGHIFGDHTVYLSGWFERIELTHRADSRAPFAAGALRAAEFLVNQKPRLYTMFDVLGF